MRTLEPMNDRHTAVLAFIKEYRGQHNYSPSIREIANALGLSSTSLVEYYLIRLEDEGKIKRDPGIARSITVIDEKIVGEMTF